MALSNAELENIRKSAEQAVMQKRVAQAVRAKRAEQNRRREEHAEASSSVPVEVKTPSVPELSLTEKQKRRRDSANLLQQMTSSDPATEVQKAEIRAQKAEKVYGDYLQSEERAQKQAEFDRENRKNTLSPMNSVPGAYAAAAQKPEALPVDEKENELEAAAGYYRTQANKTKDEEITRRNMEEFNSWPEEDRKALERYIIERNQEKYNVNADSPMINSHSNAADLFRKYGDKKVREIAESYTRIENEKLARDVERAAREGAGSSVAGAIGHSALSVGANTAGAITGPVEYLNELLGRTGQYSTLDPNNIGGIFNTYSGAVRSQVAQDIAGDGGALRKGLSYGYQGIMGAADTLARVALGGGSKVATLGLAASGSFGQTMSQASAQGATPAQAVALATANAFIETGTEYLPLDNLLKTAKGGAQGTKAAIQNALKQGGMEIIEEEASFLGSLAAETAILREKSSYKQQIGELVANGMSYQQAREQADRAVWREALDTAIVSGISGGVSSAGASVVADTRTREQRLFDGIFKAVKEQRQKMGQIPMDTQDGTKKEFDVSASVAESTKPKYVPTAAAGQNDQTSTQPTDIPAQSTEGGQDEMEHGAVGAAERGFSNKAAYQDLLYDGNVQPDRADDARPMEVPKTDVNGAPVSEVAANIYGSKITSDEFASLMEEPIARGDFSYAKITNDQATQMAMESIKRSGNWDSAYTQWAKQVAVGNAGAEMAARGALLLNHAAQEGDKTKWLEILSDMQTLGTNTAQGLQAFRILRSLKPADKVEFVKMSVRKMVEDMKLGVDIRIDESLLDSYQNAKTDAEADAILEQIQEDVASQIPSTAMDKWTALRYLNMLGNFRTQIRNVAGNVGAQATYRVKDTIGAALEAAASKASGGKLERTKSFIVDKELKKAAMADFENIKDAAMGGGKYDDARSESGAFAKGVMEKRTIFKNPVMEHYRKATNWAMNNRYFGDEAFSKAAYSRAMAGYLQANGVTAETFNSADPELMDRARSYAIREAQEATFRDNNTVSDWISKIGRRKDTPKAARAIAEGVMPFRKTPANVLVRAEEFSPLGLINSAVKTKQAAKGEISGAEVINSWAKTLTGSGLVALGVFLGRAGYLIGGPDEDEDKAEFDELTGYQNYALQLPDGTNLTIDFLSPMAMPLFMGAQWAKITEDKNLQLSELETAILSLSDPMIQMSMLQGVNDTLDGIKYSKNNMGQFLLNAATSYLTQGITNTLLGQIERSGEDSRMTTYVDKNSQLSPWVQRQLGKVSQKVPGWDYQQIPYVNAWGEEEASFEGAYNYLYNMFSPAYISKAETNALTEELYRLNKAQSETNVFPQRPENALNFTGADGTKHEGYALNAQEYVTLEKVQGQTAKRVLLELIDSDGYKALTDSQKAEAVKLVYDYSREKARTEAVADYPGVSAAWMKSIEGKETQTIIRKVAGDSVSNALADAGEAIKNGWDIAETAEALESAYDSYKSLSRAEQKQVAQNADSVTWGYIKVREDGVTTKQYLDLSKAVEGLKPLAGNKGVTQMQKAEKAVQFPGLTESQRAAVVKMYVSSAQDQNLDEMKKLGFDTADYMTAWQIYSGESGKGKKQRTVEKYMDKFGVDEKTAKAIYEIYE